MEQKRNYILFNCNEDIGRIIAMTEKQAKVLRSALEDITDEVGLELADEFIGEEI